LKTADILKFLRGRKAARREDTDLRSSAPEARARALYRHGRTKMREGDLAGGVELFEQAIALLPDYAEAVAARAESLDMLGQSDKAAGEYLKARELWARQRSGAPDRRYLYRQHGRFTFEVDSYELALRRIKTGAFPHLACGNVLLAQGHAAEALDCYEAALKVKRNNPDILALKGEALAAMGRHVEAIDAFDLALEASPKSPEVLNSRAISRAALGKMAEANADWRRQLDLLPASQNAARAYVALRLADYELALSEIEPAEAKAPGDPYWQLYRLTALKRLGRPVPAVDVPADDRWPVPLIALLAGMASADEVLKAATTRERRVEAAFQLGRWKDVVEQGPPALVECCAARNELMRQGS
jgi:tetratricopeptide (TPR) repeat protein